jgi:hypothetical protein
MNDAPKTHLRIDFIVREVSDDGLTPDDDLRYVKFGDEVPIAHVRDFFERCGNAMGTMFRSTGGSVLEFVNTGANKIAVIKVVRELGGYGLKEAKDLVEAPMGTAIVVCKDSYSLENAIMMLNNAGAKVQGRMARESDNLPRTSGAWQLPALATYTRHM